MSYFVIKKKKPEDLLPDDIASSTQDRIISFRYGCRYAVVIVNRCFTLGKGYRTFQTPQQVKRESHKIRNIPHQIIDKEGNRYHFTLDGRLIKDTVLKPVAK